MAPSGISLQPYVSSVPPNREPLTATIGLTVQGPRAQGLYLMGDGTTQVSPDHPLGDALHRDLVALLSGYGYQATGGSGNPEAPIDAQLDARIVTAMVWQGKGTVTAAVVLTLALLDSARNQRLWFGTFQSEATAKQGMFGGAARPAGEALNQAYRQALDAASAALSGQPFERAIRDKKPVGAPVGFAEEALFGFDPCAQINNVDTSRDGAHTAWLEGSRAGMRVVVDGVAGPVFASLGKTPYSFSPDGHHVAYAAGGKSRFLVMLDQTPGPEFDGISNSVPPTFSPDSRHLIYGALVEGTDRLVIDGAAQTLFELAPILPVFSPDGSRLAYVAQRGTTGTSARQWVVIDAAAGAEFDRIDSAPGRMTFSPDSRRFAYLGERGKRWMVVVDGEEQSHGDVGAPLFSPDSRHLAYAAQEGNQVRVILDGIPGAPVDGATFLTFSPDGTRLAYIAALGKAKMIIVDGVPGPAFDAVWPAISFSPDGARFAYFGKQGEKAVLMLDGIRGPEYDDVSAGPLFSPDGLRLAYSIRRGSQAMVIVDGNSGPAFDAVSAPVFSPDSRRIAYTARKGKKAMVVVDHAAGAEFGEVAFAFSPDSAHVASTCRQSEQEAQDGLSWRPALDASEVGPAFSSLTGPFFTAGNVSFCGTRRGTIYRIAHALSPNQAGETHHGKPVAAEAKN